MLVTKVHYHQQQRTFDIHFDNDKMYTLSAEFLRTHSPSADVQGHGNPQLVPNKRDVQIVNINQVGHYAIKLTFDDGHDNGLYSWQYLAHLCKNQQSLWKKYLAQLKQANAARDTLIPIKIKP